MRRTLLGLSLAALSLPVLQSQPAAASGCSYETVDLGGVAAVYVDNDFPAGDPLGVWLYVDFDGDGLARDDSGCDAGGDGVYSDDWVF